jgi:hypothetical protein
MSARCVGSVSHDHGCHKQTTDTAFEPKPLPRSIQYAVNAMLIWSESSRKDVTPTAYYLKPYSLYGQFASSLAMSHVANEVYVRRLLTQGHGYPVYGPKPDDNLPLEYRDRGTSIGDLVIITPDGTIDFLFNICLPWDHPVNDGRTPECFEMVNLVPSKDLSSMEDWHAIGSSIASSSVKKKSLTADVAVTVP